MGFPKTISLLFLTMALLGAPTMATEYIVGDDAGWNTGVDYQAWASRYTFRQGDTLRFVFRGDGEHDVEQLLRPEEFAGCMSGTAGLLYPSNTNIPLEDVGTYYFICGFPNMCQNGMKLQVTVLPAGHGGTQTPTGPSGPETFFPQTPPSPTTNIDPRTVVSLRPHGAASSLSLSAWVNIALLIFTTSCGLFLQL